MNAALSCSCEAGTEAKESRSTAFSRALNRLSVDVFVVLKLQRASDFCPADAREVSSFNFIIGERGSSYIVRQSNEEIESSLREVPSLWSYGLRIGGVEETGVYCGNIDVMS